MYVCRYKQYFHSFDWALYVVIDIFEVDTFVDDIKSKTKQFYLKYLEIVWFFVLCFLKKPVIL